MKIKESHKQGICPVCREDIWSDEAIAKVKIKGKSFPVWVHEYHCTDTSIDKLKDYCDKFWKTHDSDYGFNPPLCELKPHLEIESTLITLSKLKKILAESNNSKTEWKFRYDHEPGHYEVITMTSFNDLYDLWYETKKDLTITFDENEFSEDDFMNEVDGIIKVKN